MSASKSNNDSNDANDPSTTNDDSNGNTSSFSRLLSTKTSTNRGLRRRGSLFDDLPSRQNNSTDEASSFSLSSMLQTSTSTGGTWQKRRSKSQDNRKRRRESFRTGSEDEPSSNVSASRSLFTSSQLNATSTTANNSQLTTGTTSTIVPEDTCTSGTLNSIASYPSSSTPKASGRTSLFGSVMQQVGGAKGCSNTPMKGVPGGLTTTTPLVRRGSVFSPSNNKSRESFGTPGGFQLFDFVNNFGSPYSNNSNQSTSKKKNESPSNNSNVNHTDWQNACLDQGVMDWSLPESVRFDFHPGHIINPILQTKPGSGSGLLHFLQPKTTSGVVDGLGEWEAGLLYWQHPAVYPSPFVSETSSSAAAAAALKAKDADANNTKKEAGKDTTDKLLRPKHSSSSSNHHVKKKRRATLDLADTKPLVETSNFTATVQAATKPSLARLQRQTTNFTRQRRLEWQQSFASLYWKWIAQLRELGEETHVNNSYFYACGTDHTVLFRGVHESGKVLPQIAFTSSSRAFRKSLSHAGVEAILLLEEWNGHSRNAVFSETMIIRQQRKQLSKEKGQSTSSKSKVQDPQAGAASKENNPQSTNDTANNSNRSSGAEKSNLAAPTPSKTTTTSSPAESSNSPFVKEELAALRRAQVFGETVGADVSVSIKPKVAVGPKVSLGSLPPLVVTGWDDCAAFFEVYMNVGTCCGLSSTKFSGKQLEAVGEDEKASPKADNRSRNAELSRPRMDWQAMHDVPRLICRGLGPFANATMKSLIVQGVPHYGQTDAEAEPNNHEYASLEILGGPILPCTINELFRGLANMMVADQKDRTGSATQDKDDDDDDDGPVSSHSLILRALPTVSQRQLEEELVQRHGIVGAAGPKSLNTCYEKGIGRDEERNMPRQIPNGMILETGVWDVLHPGAMAYKLERVDAAATGAFLP